MGCGPGMTCWRRLKEWHAAEVWERLHEALLDRLGQADRIDWERASLDSAAVPVPGGAKRRAPTRRIAREGATGTIEIGLGHGVPTPRLCKGLPGNARPAAARHVAGRRGPRLAPAPSVQGAGVAGTVGRYAAEPRVTPPRLPEESRRFDGVFADLAWLVRPGGAVLLDETTA